MHYLNRDVVEAPECLGHYDYKRNTWKDLDGPCKQRLRAQLSEMQGIPEVSTADGAEEYGVRCAYCEGPIYSDGHIEHFRRKNNKHYPELTFSWENLFLVCGSGAHCGHYKDRPSADMYLPDHLVKPDVHNPEEHFFFSSSGEISPREGLDVTARHMAQETIRVFNLNHGSLIGKRRARVQPFLANMTGIMELFMYESGPDEELKEIEDEMMAGLAADIECARYDPYSAVLRELIRSKQ